MPRTIEISGPRPTIERMLRDARDMEGVVSRSVQLGASLDPQGRPRGDILTFQATNAGCRRVLTAVDRIGLDRFETVTTSEPYSLIKKEARKTIENESNEGAWEETASLLRRDANINANYLGLMTISGGVAAVGIWTETLHIVIGAMLVAPGFEPLARISFGLIAGPISAALRGLGATLLGYLLLGLGAAATGFVMQAIGASPSEALPERDLMRYWSQINGGATVIGLLAGAAGAFILSSRRTVFAAGVMVALALVPGVAIFGLSFVTGEYEMGLQALARWAHDAGLVLVASAVVFGVKQAVVHRRRALD